MNYINFSNKKKRIDLFDHLCGGGEGGSDPGADAWIAVMSVWFEMHNHSLEQYRHLWALH